MIRYYYDSELDRYLRVRMEEIPLYYSPMLLGEPTLHKARVFDAMGADCGDTYVLSSCFQYGSLRRVKLSSCPRKVRRGVSRFTEQYAWPRREA